MFRDSLPQRVHVCAAAALFLGIAGRTTHSFAQSPDFAEGNAAQWGSFAPVDNAATTVANSTAKVKLGSSSILFTTQSGFDTGVKYPAAPTLNYNASAFNYLTFWEWPENSTPFGWQGNQPIVVVRTSTGVITLEPAAQLTSNVAWKLFKVPLAGGGGWTRTQTGTPDLAHVTQIEIHHDTWDYAFQIYVDAVRFMQLTPGGLPPRGPTPPAAVDPDAISPKVYLYIFDPIMENFGSRRMHEVYAWTDPVVLTHDVMNDLLVSSHGRARFQIVDSVIADEYPRFVDGFQHNDATFAADWAAHIFHNSTFDYVGFSQAHNLGTRVDAGEIDEVWVYAPPIAGMWESCMAGQGAYWVNGPTYPAAGGQRAFVVMGWNFERGVGEAIHSWGHRAESVLVHSYAQWCQDRCNTWSRFTLLDINQSGLGGVGNVHFPVNAQSDYDYANTRFVASNADAWVDYPTLNNNTRQMDFHEWSKNGTDPQREYLNWWYAHMPHAPGKAPDQYLSNWWRYLLDIDQFKSWDGNLNLSIGIPTVRITSPAAGSSVRGAVAVRADAEVDGALGRVDLYVDGVFVATDSLAPFTFEWHSPDAPGSHTLVAKAYELQNGTEAVSAPVTITTGACTADVDDGSFTGTPDGGVTIDDLLYFLFRFDLGC